MTIATTDEIKTFINADPTKVDAALLDLLIPGVTADIEEFLGFTIAKSNYDEFYPVSSRLSNGFDSLVDNIPYDSIGGRAVPQFGSVENPRFRLQLRNVPVLVEGLEVWERYGAYAGQTPSSPWVDETKLVNGRDYYPDLDDAVRSATGVLIRVNAEWSSEPRSIRVKYSSGFTAAELNGTEGARRAAAVKLSFLESIAFRYRDTIISRGDKKGEFKAGTVTGESIGNYSYTLANTQLYGQQQRLPKSATDRMQTFRNYGRYMA